MDRRVATTDMGKEILSRIDQLAALTETPGSLTRTYLTPCHREAANLVLGWMSAAGMDASVDPVGNVVGRYEGNRPGLPALILGSHLDTVRDAGKFDGMLGVIGAIACVDALNRAGERFDFAIEVVGFGDEEGVRFQSTLFGSRALAGTLEAAVLESRDADGVRLADALRAFGLDPARIDAAARRPEQVLAYVELHIEQGPVLEAEGLPVGVVTSIAGATRLDVRLKGEPGHAGTVPMAMRRDALAAAADAILAVERHCTATAGLVGTVGRIEALPGTVNVIPGDVRFSIDIRAEQDPLRHRAVEAVTNAIAAIGERRGVCPTVRKTHDAPSRVCAPWLMEQLAEAVRGEGLAVRRLPSGAGHDAMAMADLTDVGMLFVRCERGISHAPAESITAEDAGTAARVLLRFIRSFTPTQERS
jgi:allantoate deiminase